MAGTMTNPDQDARLSWRVRDSLLVYVLGVGGSIEVAESARADDGLYTFAFDERHSDAGIAAYRGSVHLRAHEGLMDVLIVDPWIHLNPQGMQLSIGSSDPESRSVLMDLVAAEPVVAGGLTVWRDVGTRLAATGAAAFAFNYPVGAEFAPLSFSMSQGVAGGPSGA